MAKKGDSNGYAFVTTFFSIIGFIIALLAWKKNKYVMYYAKQSLVIFIVAIIAGIISSVVGWITVMGWIIALALNVIVFIMWLLSWVYSLSGKEKEVIIAGGFAKKIKL